MIIVKNTNIKYLIIIVSFLVIFTVFLLVSLSIISRFEEIDNEILSGDIKGSDVVALVICNRIVSLISFASIGVVIFSIIRLIILNVNHSNVSKKIIIVESCILILSIIIFVVCSIVYNDIQYKFGMAENKTELDELQAKYVHLLNFSLYSTFTLIGLIISLLFIVVYDIVKYNKASSN